MLKRFVCAAFVGLAVLVSGTAAWASLIPTGTLAFTTPTGTVGPTDSIDVWMSLSLTPGTGALQTDAVGAVVGLTLADIQVYNPGFSSQDFSSAVIDGYGCSGTFTTTCITGPPYDFAFALNGPSKPLSMAYPANLSLVDGSTTPFLFGTYTPTGGGPVPAGVYEFYHAVVWVYVHDNTGVDPDVFIKIAETPFSGGTGDQMFQRTVLGGAAPEPASFFLLGAGLVGVARAWRKRRL